jgi:hypothetical protein
MEIPRRAQFETKVVLTWDSVQSLPTDKLTPALEPNAEE